MVRWEVWERTIRYLSLQSGEASYPEDLSGAGLLLRAVLSVLVLSERDGFRVLLRVASAPPTRTHTHSLLSRLIALLAHSYLVEI